MKPTINPMKGQIVPKKARMKDCCLSSSKFECFYRERIREATPKPIPHPIHHPNKLCNTIINGEVVKILFQLKWCRCWKTPIHDHPRPYKLSYLRNKTKSKWQKIAKCSFLFAKNFKIRYGAILFQFLSFITRLNHVMMATITLKCLSMMKSGWYLWNLMMKLKELWRIWWYPNPYLWELCKTQCSPIH